MPGHDQTDVRCRRRRARTWLALAAGLALAATGHAGARGQDPAAVTAAAWQGDEAAPVRLMADRVQRWEDGGALWFLLEDDARVDQGDVALMARRMVAKVVRAGRSDGTVHRVELYAEGEVCDPGQPDATFAAIRTELVTTDRVSLDAREPANLHELKKPPRGLPILARAFTTPAESTPAPAGDGPLVPTGATAPAEAEAGGDAPPAAPLAMPFGSPGPARPAEAAGNSDASVRPAQAAVGNGPGFPDDFSAPVVPDQAPPPLPDPLAQDPLPVGPNLAPLGPEAAPLDSEPPTTILPLPDGTRRPGPGSPAPNVRAEDAGVVVDPGSQRVITINTRVGTTIRSEETDADGTKRIVILNGVNIVTQSPEQGIVDLEADKVVIFIREDKGEVDWTNFNGRILTRKTQPVEFYLEGHVVMRQDQLKLQGKTDTRAINADRAYYDLQSQRLLALDAQIELYTPTTITPMKVTAPRILQFHKMVQAPDGRVLPSAFATIQADRTVTTGSRFANPGYRFTSRSIDIEQVVDSQARPNETGLPYDQNDLTWQVDARQNFFFIGRVPFFYWPRFYVEADDLNPPLQGLTFATNNYFGQQIRSDFDLFNILNIRHIPQIDVWNLDLDYLSARDRAPGQGIALGTEVGWYGKDLINDFKDPYHRIPGTKPSRLGAYAGFFDAYGLFDGSRDVLGFGPAIITNGPNNNAAGRAGFSRISNPTFQTFRGRITARHMQSFTTPDTPLDEDFRVNLEVGFFSDRNFLEQYFKRLFDTGLDQETLVYGIKQKQNRTFTFLGEVNLQTFNTETQWLPRLDYYRLGDSLLGDRLTYFQHSGVDYANVHTAAEVNNRTLFAYLPLDPISNTNRRFESGRLYTNQELDLPVNLGFLRVTPYVQGQLVGWNNQINNQAVGRYWGAVGARADMTFWKVYPDAESELLNVHGLNHKIDLVADFRDAYSNVNLNSIGVQDDLDDNSYEYARRYFALVNYGGGVLPPQYDPRLLILRRGLSPITGTTDVQASIETLKLGIHQRLQTKRGQEGRRHINDYMIFDLDTTYFPNAARDNFNKPFGQNFFNYEWYLGDRTSFVSYGWFEFFKIAGTPYINNATQGKNDPFGLKIITSGISITRIPKGNVFIGYSIVNTGPIATSALNASYTYWLSPKWYGTAATSYDFGNRLLLGASGSLTRIGADYLTSVGLAVSPLQNSYQFVFEISPRLSPNMRFGSASGLSRVDTRFAPVE